MKRLKLPSKTPLIVSLILSVLIFSKESVFAQSGNLDNTFGGDGKVVGNPFSEVVTVSSAAIQSDGKIIVACTSRLPDSYDYKTYLVRYKPDGSVDSSFGLNGISLLSSGGIRHIITIAIDGEGRILVSYSTGESLGANYFNLIRVLQNGVKDSFYAENPTNDAFSAIRSIKLQPDGKILAAGYTVSFGYWGSFLIRYLDNGKLDSVFAKNGAMLRNGSDDAGNIDDLASMALQPDGKIIMAGEYYKFEDEIRYFFLTRYQKNGALDSSFGVNGDVFTKFTKTYNICNDVIVQPDKKIVVAGFTANGYYNDDSSNFAVARYLPGGNLDDDFGNNGLVETDFNRHEDCATSMGIQDDGKLVVAGWNTQIGSTTDFALARYFSNGSLDPVFGTNGKVTTDFFGEDDNGIKMLIQTDHKIIVAGDAIPDTDPFYRDIALARYTTENTLPLKIVYFNALKKDTSVLLKWQAVAEENSAYFSMERSNTGSNNFLEIGRIYTKGNSNQLEQYSFEDLSPLAGGNYYRLKQVGKDVEANYSKTVLVSFDKTVSIAIYPNPVKDELFIKGLNGDLTTISMVNMQGHTLIRTSTANTIFNMNLKAIPAGIYYLKLETTKYITTLKFVKE